jgi:Stage II sporulation protein E (SpoIIE)
MTTDNRVVDVSQDWLQACSVQERFMRGPAGDNCQLDYSASCRQMRALGGDCYDFACLGDGQIAMLVGDASGKGVAAALMMASVQASLRTAAQFTGNNLASLFRAANVHACASSLADRYATLFYGVLNRVALTLRSRLRRPGGCSPRMNSFGRSSIPWTPFPEASRQTMRRWRSCEPSEKENPLREQSRVSRRHRDAVNPFVRSTRS